MEVPPSDVVHRAQYFFSQKTLKILSGWSFQNIKMKRKKHHNEISA